MSEEKYQEGQGQEDATNIYVSVPNGLAAALLASLPVAELTDELRKVRADWLAGVKDTLRHVEANLGDAETGIFLVQENVTGPDGETRTSFRFHGGLFGSDEALLALAMYATECVNQRMAARTKVKPPEGMTEADRCPGCGQFHTKEEIALAAAPASPTAH